MGKEELQHPQQLAAAAGNSAKTGQAKSYFFILGRPQPSESVLVEPGIDPAEDDGRESIGRQLKVVRRLSIYHLRRIWQGGGRRFGRPVANPAATTDQGSPQRIEAGPCAWICVSKANKRIIGNAGRKRMPPPRRDEVRERPQPVSRYGRDAPGVYRATGVQLLKPTVTDDQRRDGLHPCRCFVWLMAEGLFEERGSEDLATVAIQSRSRLRPGHDVLRDGARVRCCDPAGLGEHLREDLTAEAGHVSGIRTVSHTLPHSRPHTTPSPQPLPVPACSA